MARGREVETDLGLEPPDVQGHCHAWPHRKRRGVDVLGIEPDHTVTELPDPIPVGLARSFVNLVEQRVYLLPDSLRHDQALMVRDGRPELAADRPRIRIDSPTIRRRY